MEHVTISAGSTGLRSIKDISIEASVQQAARCFTVEASLTLGGGGPEAAFFPPTPVKITTQQVLAGGRLGPAELLFTGYVDRFSPRLKAQESTLSFAGRSKGADACDCAVDHTRGDYVGKSLLDIAKDQDAYGIGFTSDFQMDSIDRTRPNIGESLFSFLRTHTDAEQCTMAGQADGSIKFTRAGVNPPRQAGALIEGTSFFAGDADFDWSRRHSEYHVHGQSHKGTGPSATQIHAQETDGAVTRHRRVHIVHPGHTDADRVAKHARNHRNAAAGEGTRLSYTANSWRDGSGALWVPGNKVWVEAPTLFLAQDLLIERVTYRLSGDHGEYASLDLVDPQAHGGTAGRGVNKSSSIWATPQ